MEALAALLGRWNAYPRGVEVGLPFIMDARTMRAVPFLTIATREGDLDVMDRIDSVGDYASVAAHSERVDALGIEFPILDLPTLIRARKAAGRAKDREAVLELEVLRELRRGYSDWSAKRSRAVSIDPARQRGWRHRLHARNQRTRLRIHHEQVTVLLPDEPCRHGVIEKAQERCEEAADFEEPVWLLVQAKLPPRPHLKQFLERTEPTRHGKKAIGQLGEQRLSLVHGRDNAQLREPTVRHLAIHQMARHDADHFAPRRQRPFGECAHETRAATPVHESPPAFREKATHRDGLLRVHGIVPGICRAKNTHRVQRQRSVRSSRRIPDIRCIAARRLGGMSRLMNRQNHIPRISRFNRVASAIIE